MGDCGAYISDNGAISDGDVSAEKMWRTLSHWVCVVWREDWRVTRRELDGDAVLVGP